MVKVDRVKARTKRAVKRKRIFNRKVLRGSEILNNLNHLLNDNIESFVDKQKDIFKTSTSSFRELQPILNLTPQKNAYVQNKDVIGYRIIDCSILSDAVSVLSCPTCFQTTLAITENISKKRGLACELSIFCSKCKYRNNFYTSKLLNQKGIFDINTRTIYTMRTLGIGYSGIQKFTTLMNMPKPMTSKNYDKLVLKIANITEEVAQETMADAVAELRQNCQNEDEILDIGISCDGTWQRRGFSSLNGVVAALSLDSGKVIDVEVMSRFCRGCSLNQNLAKRNPTAYAKWKNLHNCKMNFIGSASGMECEGASRIFHRSIQKHKLKYVNFLGDGDSKSYNIVKDVYPDTQVTKLECVGHYQKRVGTRLRKLKKKVRGLGGRGRLTDATIGRLQNFFGIAIRQNTGDIVAMKSSALATLFHVASLKDNNWHYPHCPMGASSWCKFNRDKVNKTNTYKPGPGLPLEVVYKIRPVFEDLTKDDELKNVFMAKH